MKRSRGRRTKRNIKYVKRVTRPGFSPDTIYQSSLGQFVRSKSSRTTAAAPGARAGAANLGETTSVSAGAAGGGVTEEPARCSHRLRAAQLGRADALRRRRTAQDRQQRGGAGATADRAWPQKLALRRERSGRPSHRHPVFAGPDLQAPADQSVRVSARCDPARLDASGAASPGADATRVEAPAAGFRRTSRRLNGAFLTIRPRFLPASSISIYVSIGISDHVLRYWPLDGGDGVGPTLTRFQSFHRIAPRACAVAETEVE